MGRFLEFGFAGRNQLLGFDSAGRPTRAEIQNEIRIGLRIDDVFPITVELFGFGPTTPVTTPAPGEVFDATGSVLSSLANRGG